ncbi:3'-5' exonuclease, partial [Sphaerisporangium sp. NPDC051017]|uniref:3'-5' exonuclease n=1 Tax=Sphaerisporangium sp. NPDC051017 TaxID=3154636 RepID=UPI00341893C3
MTDPDFLAMTYLVIDFEALTPTGRPAEPIEVAAIAGRFSATGAWRELGRYSALMRPPDDVPITSFDVRQNGLTEEVLRSQRPQAEVMAELDGLLTTPPYRLVAHSAHIEATLIKGKRSHCPTLAATPLLCTVKLARIAYPELHSHALNELLSFLRIPKPADRHRALPDVQLTVAILQAILSAGVEAGAWRTLWDLQIAAGVYVKSQP